jgi:hypothetical protein
LKCELRRLEKEKNALNDETRYMRQSLRFEENTYTSINGLPTRSFSCRNELLNTFVQNDPEFSPKKGVDCQKCPNLKIKFKKLKKDHKDVLSMNQLLMENINEYNSIYHNSREKNEVLSEKLTTIYNFLLTLEGMGARNQAKLSARILERLKGFASGESSDLNFESLPPESRMGVDADPEIGRSTDKKASSSKLAEVKRELGEIGNLIKELEEQPSHDQSHNSSLSNEITETSMATSKKKKNEYFKKIWDLKS